MEQLQITDGDMLALHVRDMMGSTGVPQQAARRPQQAPAPSRNRGEQDPEVIRLQLLGNPRMRQEITQQRPDLAAALDDPVRFAQAYHQLQNAERQAQMSRTRQIAELNSDPFDVEAQMRIAEMIREEQVQENLHNAIEHNPEGMLCPLLNFGPS